MPPFDKLRVTNYGTSNLMAVFINFIHLLGLVMWLGSIIFFSFFAAPPIFKLLDRKQAGEVVGAIFPKYYGIGYVCSVLVTATAFMGSGGSMDPRMVFLALMTACTFYAGMVISPQARQVKMALLEKPGDAELEKQFSSLHKFSVMLNSTVLIFGLGLLWITAMGLRL